VVNSVVHGVVVEDERTARGADAVALGVVRDVALDQRERVLLVIVQGAVLAVPHDLAQAGRARPEVEAARGDDAPEPVRRVAPDALARVEAAVEAEDDPGRRTDAAEVVAVGRPAHPADLAGVRFPATPPRADPEAACDPREERQAVLVASASDEGDVALVLGYRSDRPVHLGVHAVWQEQRAARARG